MIELTHSIQDLQLYLISGLGLNFKTIVDMFLTKIQGLNF